MSKQTATYNSNTTLNENSFVKTGSSFVKWNTKADGSGTGYDDKATVKLTDNLTLYAQWDIAKNDVTYKYEGTAPEGAPAVPSGETDVEYGTEVTVADAPTLPGYVFEGWDTEDVTVTNNKFDMPDTDVEFTGSWRKRQQNVEVDATKTVNVNAGDKLSYGDTITFTITITNDGTDDSDPITVVDPLLAGSPITAVVTTSPDGVDVTGDITDGTNGITIGSIPAGQSVVVTVTVTVEGDGAVPGTSVSSQSTITLNDDQENHVIYHDETAFSETIETEVKFVERTPNTQGYNVVVLIDESGSMGKALDSSGNYIWSGSCKDNYSNRQKAECYVDSDKFQNAKAASKYFIDLMFPSATDNTNNSNVAVYTFGSGLHGQSDDYAYAVGNSGNGIIAKDLTTATNLKNAINALGAHPFNSGTPYATALRAAAETLFGTYKYNGSHNNNGLNNANTNNKNIVIFLTDGAPTDNKENNWYSTGYENYVTDLVNNGATIYSIGFDIGESSSEFAELTRISERTTGGFAKVAPNDLSQLKNIFKFIKEAFDVPTEEWTEQGVAEISSDVVIDSDHPISIYLNGSETASKSCTSDPKDNANACEGYIVYQDGKYDVDASKFPAGSSIKVIYYVSGTRSRSAAKFNVKMRTISDPLNEKELQSSELINIEEELVNDSVKEDVDNTEMLVKEETVVNTPNEDLLDVPAVADLNEKDKVEETIEPEIVEVEDSVVDSSEKVINNETEVEKQEVIVEEVEEEIINEEVKTSEPVEETEVKEQEVIVEETEEETTKEEVKTSEPVEETEEETVEETVPSEDSKVENVESTESNSNETEVEE